MIVVASLLVMARRYKKKTTVGASEDAMSPSDPLRSRASADAHCLGTGKLGKA